MKRVNSLYMPGFTTFLIITFLFILAWTGFNIYNSATTSSISAELQQDIVPINGTFDQATIDKIVARKQVTPQFDVAPSPSATPTPATKQKPFPTQAPTKVLPSVTPGGTP